MGSIQFTDGLMAGVNNQGNPIEVGRNITKGEHAGYFQFGGSTIAVMFQKNKIKFDNDLVESSGFPVEQLLRANTKIGTVV